MPDPFSITLDKMVAHVSRRVYLITKRRITEALKLAHRDLVASSYLTARVARQKGGRNAAVKDAPKPPRKITD